jgi:hypothetical protein
MIAPFRFAQTKSVEGGESSRSARAEPSTLRLLRLPRVFADMGLLPWLEIKIAQQIKDAHPNWLTA